MKNNCTIYIDPSIKVLYASYYIQGLYDYYGRKNVVFSSQPFKKLKKRRDPELYDHFMAYIVNENETLTKLIIDYWDKTIIDENAYNWCDYYAKINVCKEVRTEKQKLIPIPPGFGIKVWNKTETLYHCIINFIKCKRDPHINFKQHYKDYKNQLKRPEIRAFEKKSCKSTYTDSTFYVFMLDNYINHKNKNNDLNAIRNQFIQSCKQLNIDFNGGMIKFDRYAEYNTNEIHGIDTNTYIENLHRSKLAFNAPSIHYSHGWKLAEYIAMGKPIISTKLPNYFPRYNFEAFPFHTVIHNSNLKSDIEMLVEDPDYRNDLSKRAKEYYAKYASPIRVIETITLNIKG